MFCKEPVKRVFTMGYKDEYIKPWHNSFFQKTYWLEYHTTEGYWLVFETENHFITAGFDGVKLYDDEKSLPQENCEKYCIDDSEQGEKSAETALFEGERLISVEKQERSWKLIFDNFTMQLFTYDEGCYRWFEYRSRMSGGEPVAGCEHRLKRHCSCGGDGEVRIDSLFDFVARCKNCHASTEASISLSDAIDDWNKGQTHWHFDTDYELFKEQIKKEGVEYIALSNQGQWFIDDDACEVDSIIVAFSECFYKLACIRVQEDEEEFTVSKISGYNRELYTKEVRPSDGKKMSFIMFDYTDGSPDLWLTLDDAQLHIGTNDDISVFVGLGSIDENWSEKKRSALIV